MERAFHPETIPRYASHIVPGTVQRVGHASNESVRYPCVPLSFQLSPEDIAQLTEASERQLSELCLRSLYDQPDIVARYLDTRHITEAQRQEITEKLDRIPHSDEVD